MLPFGRVVGIAESYDDGASSSLAAFHHVKVAKRAVHELWTARDWSWLYDEFTVTTVAPYSTGTIAFTQNSATITGTGTAWSTSWPTPIILTGNDGQPWFVSAILSPTSATLEKEWPYANASAQSYRFSFPACSLPTDFGQMSDPIQAAVLFQGRPASYSEWYELTQMLRYTGQLQVYAFKDGDGITEPPKLMLFPAPSAVSVIRASYRAKAPVLRYHTKGDVTTLSAGGTTVTGSGTIWTKLGYSAVGQIIEFPSLETDAYGEVSAAPGDTSLTIPAWGGPAIAEATGYRLSTPLRIPTEFEEALTLLIDESVAVQRGFSNSAAIARGAYEKLLNQLQMRHQTPIDAQRVLLPSALQGALPGAMRRNIAPGPPVTVIVES